MVEVVRLTPTMSSRKVVVLDFVTRWLGEHPGSSPSLKMIAAGAGCCKARAAALVNALVRDSKLVCGPPARPGGPRVLMLPGRFARAKAELRASGWIVEDEIRWAGPPERAVTFSTLPLLAVRAQTSEGGLGGSGGDGENRA